ncbi:MAG: tRNA (N(6)-L-threonylcarbamoyladenosine(37)-C(2))-methylthiotransferase MtaB [Opitutae bacterium]|nr:tRNA (N(6)-L-threonylcarbamoyladenosine(37)-C(2))-methylthiotransferase MtaB [Opitutae bacterium]
MKRPNEIIMTGSGKKASVKALGCRLNQYEALAMEGKLKAAGYEIVSYGEDADLGVINSCTVTNEADAKSRNAIRRFIRKNPEAMTVVVGCYSQMAANRIAMIDGVDYVIGNHDKLNFLDYLTDDKPATPVIVRERISREDFSIGFVGDPDFEQRANLKIQDGCDFMCSFCVIPFARGRARSRDWEDLFEEVRQMIRKGVREFILTGVNLGTYESSGNDFLTLVEALADLRGVDRLRISSVEPTTIPHELFDMMADPGHSLMPYLHIPMQSCCDRTLAGMKRKYGMKEMTDFFDRAVQAIPQLCLGTDLMVGFPGETESEFEETCERFLELPFAYCHVFTFSERAGTPAAKMDKQLQMEEKRLRSARLRRLSAAKRMSFHEKQLGQVFRVLLENPKDEFYSGYTDHYVRVVVPQAPAGLENRMALVEMEKATPEFIEGSLLSYEGE